MTDLITLPREIIVKIIAQSGLDTLRGLHIGPGQLPALPRTLVLTHGSDRNPGAGQTTSRS